ncbi:MAG: malic enzyme-like NAD(P)-binding protein [Patescibacteria group bacterium]
MNDLKTLALNYHALPQPGKINVVPSKSMDSINDLSLGYTPGVAEPCMEIARDNSLAYKYTAKGNLIAVISNGTAVLGLGNIGAMAAKPVMEGKGNLFKRFANIDVFDLEINEQEPDRFVEIVKSLEPTFGGINLEDIKAPECFEIEERLMEEMRIPVFHDDQHGTAVIVGAAMTNALAIAEKEIDAVKIVFSGAGSAAIACANMLIDLGAKQENVFMFDSVGLLTRQRLAELNKYKEKFAQEKKQTLAEAMRDADVFIGVSKGGIISGDELRLMAAQPIVFAMANPVPEISWVDAKAARADIIMATGRSDFPNQVNNVLCFPFVFRGSLDVRAVKINKQMMLAAVKAIAALAREPVVQEVVDIYQKNFVFGTEYILPKPFDPRLLTRVASSVAKAAIDSGVAAQPIDDFENYEKYLGDLSKRLAKGEYVGN